MADNNLPRASSGGGAGERVLHATVESLSNDDTYDTGFGTVVAANTTASGDGNIATVTSTSDGVITLGLLDDAGATVSTAEDIHIIAVCER